MRRLTYCYNFFGIDYYVTSADREIPSGRHQVRMEFAGDGGGLALGATSRSTTTVSRSGRGGCGPHAADRVLRRRGATSGDTGSPSPDYRPGTSPPARSTGWRSLPATTTTTTCATASRGPHAHRDGQLCDYPALTERDGPAFAGAPAARAASRSTTTGSAKPRPSADALPANAPSATGGADECAAVAEQVDPGDDFVAAVGIELAGPAERDRDEQARGATGQGESDDRGSRRMNGDDQRTPGASDERADDTGAQLYRRTIGSAANLARQDNAEIGGIRQRGHRLRRLESVLHVERAPRRHRGVDDEGREHQSADHPDPAQRQARIVVGVIGRRAHGDVAIPEPQDEKGDDDGEPGGDGDRCKGVQALLIGSPEGERAENRGDRVGGVEASEQWC